MNVNEFIEAWRSIPPDPHPYHTLQVSLILLSVLLAIRTILSR